MLINCDKNKITQSRCSKLYKNLNTNYINFIPFTLKTYTIILKQKKYSLDVLGDIKYLHKIIR